MPPPIRRVGWYRLRSGGATQIAPRLLAVSVTVTPVVVAGSTTIPAPTISGGAVASPVVVAATTTIPTPTRAVSLLGEWLANETSGSTVADTSGNSRDGTIVGSATRVPGRHGNAVRETANGDGFTVPGTGLTPASVTLMGWFKVDSQTFIMAAGITNNASYDAYALFTDWDASGSSDYGARFDAAGDTYWIRPGTASPTDGLPHHLALTYDAVTGVGRLYLDAVQIGSVTTSPIGPIDYDIFGGPGSGGTRTFRVGHDKYGDSVRGWQDEVRVFDGALSAAEIGRWMFTPSTVQAVTAIPTPSVSTATSANVTPAVVAGSTTIPAPTVSGRVTVAAAVVAGVATIPTPTVSGAGAATPAVVSSSTTIPTPSVSGGARPSPAVVAGSTTVPAPTVSGGARPSPAVVAAVTAIPIPSVSVAGNATVSPSVVAGSTTVPAPTVSGGARPAPPVVASATTVPSPAPSGAANPTPATVAPGSATTIPLTIPFVIGASSATTIPTPVVTTGSSATVTPVVVAASTTIPTPTLTTTIDAEMRPVIRRVGRARLGGAAVYRTPGLRLPVTNPTPSTVQAVTSIPAPTVTTVSPVTPRPVLVVQRAALAAA
jgi:hypothetical protein